MSLLDGLGHRLYVWRRGEAYHDEVKRELHFHRELDQLARSGNSISNETYYREEVRRMTLTSWLDRVQQDVSYAWRGLKRSPAFTATFIATLALGLGVNAAMYSFLDQLFTRPPAGVVNPNGVERLYLIVPSSLANGIGPYGRFTYPRYAAIRDAARRPDRVAVFSTSGSGMLIDGTIADSARTIHVSPEYFSVLGVRPLIGRFFAADEREVAVQTPVAVISERLWRRLYNASPTVLGRSVEIADRRVTIVGVAAQGFVGIDLNAGDVWLPLNMFPVPPSNGQPWYQGSGNYFEVIARIDQPSERAQLTTASAVGLRAIVDMNRSPGDTATRIVTGPINEAAGPATKARETMLAQRLAGVTLLVLLIACANLANLLLVRATQRRREFAVRRALGVSRGRLIQQMLTESILLCLIGAATTLLFASWAGTALRRLLFPSTHWASSAVDLHVIAMTLALAVVVAVVTGLLPAVAASNPDLVASLKATLSGRARSSQTQNLLLGLQAAVSVILLVAAALVVRSFDNIRSIDLGYSAEDMIIAYPSGMLRDVQQARAIAQQLPDIAARLRARPDVRAVSISNVVPMGGNAYLGVFLPGSDRRLPVAVGIVGGDHFSAAGIKMVAGRALSPQDVAGSERVAVVSERMAKETWPNEPALGKCLALFKPDAPCTRVVGIARDTHLMQVLEAGAAQFYVPATQVDSPFPSSTFILRIASGHGSAVAAAVRAELTPIFPPKTDLLVRTLDNIIEPQLRPWKMGAILFASLGILALAVACVGIYGVVAYSLATRTQEMGIRIALGARMKDVLDLVLRDGMRVVSVGILVGVVSALALGRLIRSLLFGVVPNDVSTMIGAVALLIAFAALACLAPAWRAGRIDPVTALRAD
jgi:predicted permease